jgi:hypothetical protein
MSSLLKYAMVLAIILMGIVAFSLCTECSSDAFGHALCGGTAGSRLPGRIALKLTGAFLSAVVLGLAPLELASSRFRSAASALACEPALLRVTSLRI